jgi:hypothetical protein
MPDGRLARTREAYRYQAWRDVSIDDLPLSCRAYNALKNDGWGYLDGKMTRMRPSRFQTMGDIADAPDVTFLRLKNCGKTTIRELRRLIALLEQQDVRVLQCLPRQPEPAEPSA